MNAMIGRVVVLSWIAVVSSALGCVSSVGESDTGAASGDGLELRLKEVDPGSGRIEYSLINHTENPLHVLRWKTPFDGETDRLFRIEQNGRRATFLGPIAHRLQPSPEDYLELRPGERKTTEIDLPATYDLAVGGTFEVSSNVSGRQLLLESDIQIHSKPLRIEIGSGAQKGMVQVQAQRQALVSYECTWDQTITIAQAERAAADLAEPAASAYAAQPHDDRALFWFGNQPQSSVDTIRTRLANISHGLLHGQITYECSGWQCAPGSPAHVFEWLGGWMFICPPFFDLPWELQDYTILHETAHLAGAPGDHYGGEAAHNLAQNDLATAAGNADNYAFYVIDP